MYILLEGPDGSGKSTLANRLAEHFGLDVIHNGLLDNPWDTYLGQLLHTPNLVVDRAWPSEQIYGNVMRNKDRLGDDQCRMLERVALGRGGVIIRCLPTYETCLETWQGREEYVTKAKNLKAIHDAYLHLESHLPTINYDYTKHAFNPLCESIITNTFTNNGPGIGAWRPGHSVLLLGDRSSADYEAPFVKHHGCSPWLAEQLREYDERHFYWCNVHQPGGHTLDYNVIKRLNPQKIIALGQEARTWCERENLAHVSVPHPQFWARFKRKEAYPLMEILNELF